MWLRYSQNFNDWKGNVPTSNVTKGDLKVLKGSFNDFKGRVFQAFLVEDIIKTYWLVSEFKKIVHDGKKVFQVV